MIIRLVKNMLKKYIMKIKHERHIAYNDDNPIQYIYSIKMLL